MKNKPAFAFTADQALAFDSLQEKGNCFITGGAGTGKSTLMKKWRDDVDSEGLVTLASTGTAAILLGGRTFHSYFGLGIMEGGIQAVVERASGHRGIAKRMKKAKTILVDEISMIGGQEWEAAEAIARKIRGNSLPWGGMRMIAVGDFAQLPPVNKPWCFLSERWQGTGMKHHVLKTIVRSQDADWNRCLNEIRWGMISKNTDDVLKERVKKLSPQFQGTRLYARRNQVEAHNQMKLTMLDGTVREYATEYHGNERKREEIKRQAPIPEVLLLKLGAVVMFRQNDPEQRFVNGTLGTVAAMRKDEIDVELLHGRLITVDPVKFSLLDAEGNPVASAVNFPLNLAWACTIHKAQGATLDQVHVDLSGAWEHGQGYVALSRVRKLEDLTLENWSKNYIKIDPVVRKFYEAYDESEARQDSSLDFDPPPSSDLDFQFDSEY
jgi:ATP-dependent DNA helicase PIF1